MGECADRINEIDERLAELGVADSAGWQGHGWIQMEAVGKSVDCMV